MFLSSLHGDRDDKPHRGAWDALTVGSLLGGLCMFDQRWSEKLRIRHSFVWRARRAQPALFVELLYSRCLQWCLGRPGWLVHY